jgi:hypothetical protein
VRVALVLILVCGFIARAEDGRVRNDQYGVLVFDVGCITALKAGPKTRVEFDLVDGKPDWKHGHLYEPVIDINRSCGHNEVRYVPHP